MTLRQDSLTGGPASWTPAQHEQAELRQRSVRELIAELAQLEQAARADSPLLCDMEDHKSRPRTREGRIIAELHRRHATLRRWALPDVQGPVVASQGPAARQSYEKTA